MNRKPRRWDTLGEEDPSAGLLNLLDVWVAFSVALLLALFSYLQNTPVLERTSETESFSQHVPSLQDALKMPRFRPTHDPLTGNGTRLGVAYRLNSGEVVYVPEQPDPMH